MQVASGRKAVAFFRFRRVELARGLYRLHRQPHLREGPRDRAAPSRSLFEEEEADEVYLVYNRFESALTQRPVVKRLLPVARRGRRRATKSDDDDPLAYMEYVPDAETVLKKLVPRYVETMVWQALLESAAGEHGARMTAMKNATDNANDLVQGPDACR